MRSALLVTLLAPAVALAAPPTKLAMRQIDGTNLHIAHENGAIHWSDDTRVDVELAPDGRVAAKVAGTRSEHNLYANHGQNSWTTDDVTTWTTTWTGTYKQTADKLVLALALAAETCAHTKTSSGSAPEQLACKPAAKQTTVTCTTTQITLADTKHAVDAWQCAPKASGDLGESPAWLLGKTACIEVSVPHLGHGQMQTCPPLTPP